MQLGDKITPDKLPIENNVANNVTSSNEQNANDTANENHPQWKFLDENAQSQKPQEDSKSLTWTASEYIALHKNIGWFVILGIAITLLSTIVYLITRDVIPSVAILILGSIFGIVGARKPQELTYIVNDSGINVANRHYFYTDFKSFSVMEDGAIHSIILTPLKRFMLPLSLYFEPNDEQEIIDVVSKYLPLESLQYDNLDKLMRKIRF